MNHTSSLNIPSLAMVKNCLITTVDCFVRPCLEEQPSEDVQLSERDTWRFSRHNGDQFEPPPLLQTPLILQQYRIEGYKGSLIGSHYAEKHQSIGEFCQSGLRQGK